MARAYTRSIIVAVPMPAPMHSVTNAVFLSVRSSSSKTVPRIIAPVAPKGCPMAIAPPQTFIFVVGNIEGLHIAQYHTGESFVEFEEIDVVNCHLGTLEQFVGHIHRAGQHQSRVGADIGESTNFRPWVSPIDLPPRLEPIRIAAAPSTIPDELPAWCTWLTLSTSGWAWVATASNPPISPIITKDALSEARDCMLVSGRICSSWSRMVSPLMSFTATTELLNRPSAHDLAERFWLSTE